MRRANCIGSLPPVWRRNAPAVAAAAIASRSARAADTGTGAGAPTAPAATGRRGHDARPDRARPRRRALTVPPEVVWAADPTASAAVPPEHPHPPGAPPGPGQRRRHLRRSGPTRPEPVSPAAQPEHRASAVEPAAGQPPEHPSAAAVASAVAPQLPSSPRSSHAGTLWPAYDRPPRRPDSRCSACPVSKANPSMGSTTDSMAYRLRLTRGAPGLTEARRDRRHSGHTATGDCMPGSCRSDAGTRWILGRYPDASARGVLGNRLR